jgi:hypothetical protein
MCLETSRLLTSVGTGIENEAVNQANGLGGDEGEVQQMKISLHLYIPTEKSPITCCFAENVEKTPQTPWR